jgi:hypothetical protein
MDTAEELLYRVQNGSTSVGNTSGMFQLVHQSRHRRAEACVAMEGQYFERRLYPNNSHYLLSLECKTALLLKGQMSDKY